MRNKNALLYKGIITSLFFLLISADLSAQCSVNAGSDVAICQGGNFFRTASTPLSSPTFKWYLSGNPGTTISSTSTINLTLSSSGIFNYVVQAISGSCTITDTVRVTVNAPPNVDFTTNIGANGCVSNLEVKFNSTCVSGCSNLLYFWNFGDPGSGSNNSSTLKDPTHKFTNPNQPYTVNLIVTNGVGCRDTVTKTISIGAVPDATIIDWENNTFNICSIDGDLKKLIVFNGTTTPSINSNYRIEWGDGTVYTSSVFGFNDTLSHIYPGSGYWDLKYTITSNTGCTSTRLQKVFAGSNPSVGLASLGSTIGLCVPFTQTFLIDTSLTNRNPPGTTYTVSYNDGSPDDVFFHPAPLSFTHTFTKSSCGATGSFQGNNRYFVRIQALNPCGTSWATIDPITTITKPDANFGITPSTTVCKGTQVILTDSTIGGIFVDNNGNCTNNYLRFWSITPGTNGTNYALNSGSLGTIPSITGTSQVGVTFNTTGTYTVRLIVRTNPSTGTLCNLDTIIKTISVGGFPDASITICSDSSFTYIPANANTGGTYTWTVADNPNVVGEANQTTPVAAISGNNLKNLTNVPQTLIYNITPSAAGCPANIFVLLVTVNPKPNIADTTITICSGKSFSITPSNGFRGSIIPAGTRYFWVAIPNPNVTGVVNQSAGQLSISGTLINVTDNVQVVEYNVTPISGNCQGSPFKVRVIVNPAPRVNFSPTEQVICSGQSTQLVTLTSPTPGVVIPWTAVQPVGITGVTTSGSNIIPVQTLTNSTVLPITITYKAVANIGAGANGCSGDTSIYRITVNPRPILRDTALTICGGSTFSYTPPTINGNLVPIGTTYTWTVSSNPNITGQANQVTGVTSISANNLRNMTNTPQVLVYTVTPRSGAAGSCPGAPFQITVTVNPGGVKFSIPNQTICSGQTTIPVSITTVSGTGVISWVASYPSGIIGGANSGTNTITAQTLINITTAPLEARYIASTNNQTSGCGGADTSVYTVVVNPRPIISQSGSVLISTVDLPKQWFLNGVALNGATQASYSPVQSGLYTVRVTSTGCESDPFNYIVAGLNDLEAGEYVQIAPNPFANGVQLNYKFNGSNERLNVVVMNVLGSKIMELNGLKNGAYLDLSKVSSGIYYATIYVGDTKRRVVRKLVKY